MPVVNYVWDVVSDNVLMETDDEGGTIARYVQEPELYGEAISQERDGQVRYYNYDGLGDTVELTDENQDVTDTYEYSAFGEEVARTGTTENPFGYKGSLGYYTDSETDDVYVRARTYQPTVARWLSADPLRFADGVDHYGYCHNYPVGLIDPSGLLCKQDCCCCADYLRIVLIRKLNYGHRFRYTGGISFELPNLTLDQEQGCTFEWWEMALQPIGMAALDPGVWEDQYEDFGDRDIEIWEEWNKVKKPPHQCPGGRYGFSGVDTPQSDPDFGDRDLFIKIILRSATHAYCNCAWVAVSICLYQQLRQEDGVATVVQMQTVADNFYGTLDVPVCTFGSLLADDPLSPDDPLLPGPSEPNH